MQILRREEFTSRPWKNGLGVSHVIASIPAGAGYDTVHWQVSTTAIGADCPFSSLAGMDRHFTLLEGRGVELVSHDPVSGANHRFMVDQPFAPVQFRGDWRTGCRLLEGAVRVLNVMTRRGAATAAIGMRRWSGPLLCELRPGQSVLVVVLEGQVRIEGQGSLDPQDAVLFAEKSGRYREILAPGGGARIALIRLSAP